MSTIINNYNYFGEYIVQVFGHIRTWLYVEQRNERNY